LALILGLGSLSIILLFILSLTMGAMDISFREAMSGLWNLVQNGGEHENTKELVLWQLRIPRALGVIAVGIGLSVAGAVMQALIRNPLVDPYITGVSSGAALGATMAVLAGVTILGITAYALPIIAFIGAVVAFMFTMALAEAAGGRPISYVLGGVIVSIALQAGTTLLMYFNADRLHGVLFWLFGSFAYLNWNSVTIIVLVVSVLSVVMLLFAKEFNVILLGDEQAKQLGMNVRSFKTSMFIMVSALAAVCVAFTGVIGFVGLIVPHLVRMLIGGDHRLLLPASMVVGANILLVADIVCKTVVAPSELPIGAIISIIGAPFFGYLMIRMGKEYVM
ncbi:MAG TPA: iron ABC transporter permease, partial [Methanomassiliicoccales archaeon]|nr:iron ABC transporter permease [Methanomassiliicoccales archaeon]